MHNLSPLRVSAALLCSLIILSSPSFGGESGSKGGRVVSLPAWQTVDRDFFAAGNLVVVSGTVNGDVYAAAEKIIIEGTVNGDVIGAARSISITGTVGDDVRVASEELTITGSIAKNLTSFSRNMELTGTGSIGGGMVGAATNVVLSGLVGRDVRVAAENLNISGSVGGDVETAASSVWLGPGAVVSGRLTYWSDTPATIDEKAEVKGEITRKKKEAPPTAVEEPKDVAKKVIRRSITFLGILGAVMGFASTLALGLLFVYQMPNISARSAGFVSEKPWASLGWGFVAVFMPPIVAVLLMFTIVGVPLGIMIVPFYMVTLYVGRLPAIYWAGRLVLRKPEKKGLAFLIGCLLYYLLAMVPFFGGFIVLFTVIFGLGATVLAKTQVYGKLKEQQLI